MNKRILQNGDLLFMSDQSDLSKAIIETTEKYSHVGIFFDGMLIMLQEKGEWQNRNLKNILQKKNMKFSFSATRRLMQKSSRRGQSDI